MDGITQVLILVVVSFGASCLSFYSGFGLGTLLLPVFALWFPVDQAVLMTAIIHFSNNIFKWLLTRKYIDHLIIVRFGLPAIAGAIAGALLLHLLNEISIEHSWFFMGKTRMINPIKVIIGGLIMVFGIMEFVEFGSKVWSLKSMTIGGFLSGFFGGISGHQGALRSAFLLRYDLSKEVFIATGIAIACLVDIARIMVYMPRILSGEISTNMALILWAMLGAFSGAWIGNAYLKKVKIKWIKIITAIGVILIGVAIAIGLI
jgi:uncharacterized protein